LASRVAPPPLSAAEAIKAPLRKRRSERLKLPRCQDSAHTSGFCTSEALAGLGLGEPEVSSNRWNAISPDAIRSTFGDIGGYREARAISSPNAA
jgi:hypothetical protein